MRKESEAAAAKKLHNNYTSTSREILQNENY